MKKFTDEERLNKIENWLMFEQGNFYWEMFSVLLKYFAFFFLGYLLMSVIMQVTISVIIQELPTFCERI